MLWSLALNTMISLGLLMIPACEPSLNYPESHQKDSSTMSDTTLYLNGRLEVLTIAEEMRMSHWIYAPKIIDR